jgi:hypothetical protein
MSNRITVNQFLTIVKMAASRHMPTLRVNYDDPKSELIMEEEEFAIICPIPIDEYYEANMTLRDAEDYVCELDACFFKEVDRGGEYEDPEIYVANIVLERHIESMECDVTRASYGFAWRQKENWGSWARTDARDYCEWIKEHKLNKLGEDYV